jgi:two-component system, LytTR family, response regulator
MVIPKYRTLIIDDEEPARIRLKQLLGDHAELIEIIGEAANGIEAVAQIQLLKPDLIFLDILMPGMDGFQVIQSLDEVPYIVFCTAFDHYALQAFETNSIDYLIKPVRAERLALALGKIRNLSRKSDYVDVLKLVEEMISSRQREPLTSLPVKVGERVIFLKLEDISYLEAKDKYVELITRQGKRFTLDQSLNYLEEKLPQQFRRVQRAVIINIHLIKEIRRYLGSKYTIVLDDIDQTRIVSGRNYTDTIKQLLNF